MEYACSGTVGGTCDPHSRTGTKPTVSKMKLTNDCYTIRLATRNFTEKYYRDEDGWVKISARGRLFRMTAEQVLNHLLPALAGVKPGVTVEVEYSGD